MPDCRLSKYHSQKQESTRRTIFNRGPTLQLIVQISSGNVNSSVRARAKTHGCTLASIELSRDRHLGPDACIFWARTPASTLHKNAQQGVPDAYISLCKSTIQKMRAPRRYTRPSIHVPRDACISLARVQEMCAPLLLRASKTCARRSSWVCPKMAAPTGARAKMHAPLLLATQRCARLSSYRRCDPVSSLLFFQLRSPPRSGGT